MLKNTLYPLYLLKGSMFVSTLSPEGINVFYQTGTGISLGGEIELVRFW